MSNDRKIAKGFAGGIGLTLVNIAVAFLQFRLLLEFLSQEKAGVWLLFLSMGSYVLFFDVGIGPTLGREISFSLGSLELTEEQRGLQIGTLIRTCTSVVAALAGGVFLLAVTAGWAYLRTTMAAPLHASARLAWDLYAAGAALNLVGQGWFAGIYGLGQVVTEKLVRSAGQLLGAILLAAALLLHLDLLGLAAASVVQTLTTILLARHALKLGNVHLFKLGRFDPALVRRLAGPSLKYAATLLGGILILQTDNLVIASRLGTALIPNYQAVAKLVTTLMALSTMLIVTTTPFLSQAHARNDSLEIKRLLHRNLRFSLATMVIFGSVLACFADQIIAVWLGPGHFVGFGIVWVFLLVMLLEAHHASFATATMATGRIVFLVPALLAGVLNIGFSVYLAGRLGLFGVALGTLSAQVITNNWYVPWYAMRQFGLGFSEHFHRILAPILLLLSVTLGVGFAVRRLLPSLPPVAGVCFGFGSVAVAGLLAGSVLIVSREERHALLSLLKRRLS